MAMVASIPIMATTIMISMRVNPVVRAILRFILNSFSGAT
jgi:hypothetical protein